MRGIFIHRRVRVVGVAMRGKCNRLWSGRTGFWNIWEIFRFRTFEDLLEVALGLGFLGPAMVGESRGNDASHSQALTQAGGWHHAKHTRSKRATERGGSAAQGRGGGEAAAHCSSASVGGSGPASSGTGGSAGAGGGSAGGTRSRWPGGGEGGWGGGGGEGRRRSSSLRAACGERGRKAR